MRRISVTFSLPQYTELPRLVKQVPEVEVVLFCVKTGTGQSLIKIAGKNAEKIRHRAVSGSEWIRHAQADRYHQRMLVKL
ncbi:MAG: hypothetical protein LZF60_270240 [Nitrospira sp.]|nr:MAG: hypothetical protein LZF60_270240 [Nitrospira sp.]